MSSKFYIKKGDTVYINAGDGKGKTGRVLKVFSSKNHALVEGINVVSKSVKPSSKYPHGGFEKKESPIHISNLNLLDPKSVEPTRISKRFIEDKKRVVRVSKKSGEEIK